MSGMDGIVDYLTSGDIVVTIALSTMAAILGVVLGAKVQRAARFIYPVDCMTLMLIVLIAADCLLRVTPWDPYWYLPFALGYATGYLVVGRTSYVMVWETSLANKHVDMRPMVLWEEHGQTFVQEQTQRALLRRLVCGVRHEVLSNVPLDTDWVVDAKYPLFPQFSKPTIIVEDMETTWAPEHWFWRFKVRRYTTAISIAYAGTVSKMELARDEEYLKILQRQNNGLIGKVRDMQARQGPALMEMVLRMEQGVEGASPLNRMYDLVNAQRARPGKERKNEKRKEVREDGDSKEAGGEVQ